MPGLPRATVGVDGRSRRRPNGDGKYKRKPKPDAVYDRGPDDLTLLEGDYVHAVGLMNAAFSFAWRSFADALEAWRGREGLTIDRAAEMLDLSRAQVYYLLAGTFNPSHETLLRLRALMCGGDQIPAGVKVRHNQHSGG